MIDAYVDGRPMPSRSSSFTRLASEKRGGGSVKCCDGVIALARHLLADLDDGQRLLVLERLVLAFFARLAIEREEALELHDRCRWSGTDSCGGRCRGCVRRRDVEVDRGRVEHRRRHLRRHEALPDELIELELVGAERYLRMSSGRRVGSVGRIALVRVLRVLRLCRRRRAAAPWRRYSSPNSMRR